MKKIESLPVFLACVLFVALASPSPAAAQDPVVVNPSTVTVKVDNDQVRVLEARLQPGDKEKPHSHPACVTYVISGGKVRIHAADGTVSDVTLTAGEVAYRGPVTHWGENIGKTPVHLILVELKQAVMWTALYLGELEAARKQWSASHPARYAYTMDVGSGPFGFHRVRLRYIDGKCSATIQYVLGPEKHRRERVSCEGYLMEDIFANLRRALAEGPYSYKADFDSVLGYIRSADIDPREDVQDEDWGYYMEEFRTLK